MLQLHTVFILQRPFITAIIIIKKATSPNFEEKVAFFLSGERIFMRSVCPRAVHADFQTQKKRVTSYDATLFLCSGTRD